MQTEHILLGAGGAALAYFFWKNQNSDEALAASSNARTQASSNEASNNIDIMDDPDSTDDEIARAAAALEENIKKLLAELQKNINQCNPSTACGMELLLQNLNTSYGALIAIGACIPAATRQAYIDKRTSLEKGIIDITTRLNEMKEAIKDEARMNTKIAAALAQIKIRRFRNGYYRDEAIVWAQNIAADLKNKIESKIKSLLPSAASSYATKIVNMATGDKIGEMQALLGQWFIGIDGVVFDYCSEGKKFIARGIAEDELSAAIMYEEIMATTAAQQAQTEQSIKAVFDGLKSEKISIPLLGSVAPFSQFGLSSAIGGLVTDRLKNEGTAYMQDSVNFFYFKFLNIVNPERFAALAKQGGAAVDFKAQLRAAVQRMK